MFVKSKISLQLFQQFQGALESFSEGQTYSDVIKLFLRQFCKAAIPSHYEITNKHTNEEE